MRRPERQGAAAAGLAGRSRAGSVAEQPVAGDAPQGPGSTRGGRRGEDRDGRLPGRYGHPEGLLERCRLPEGQRHEKAGREPTGRRRDDRRFRNDDAHASAPSSRNHSNEVSAPRGAGLTRFSGRSFKFKLVLYFGLLSLLPAAAAFWGFTSVAKQSEVRRVDARLQSGLRAAVTAYGEDLAARRAGASTLANDPPVAACARARRREGGAGDSSARRPTSESRRRTSRSASARRSPPSAACGSIGPNGLLGYVIASVPFDQELLRKAKQRSGLGENEQFVVVYRRQARRRRGVDTGPLDVPADRPTTVSIDDERQRVLVAATPGHVRRADARRDRAAGRDRRSGDGHPAAAAARAARSARSWLRSSRTSRDARWCERVSSIANAANAIARGKYDERVPVRGRDELARLGNAFNQMADQLQYRLEELESERHRLREAVSRFGDALAATHDTDQLLRAIVETAVEATGATGGMLIGVDGEVVEVGTPGTGVRSARAAPAGEQEHVRHALPFRPPLRRRVAPDGGVARRPVGDRARQREAAPHRRAAGAGGRHDRPRQPPPGRRRARGRALTRIPLRRAARRS